MKYLKDLKDPKDEEFDPFTFSVDNEYDDAWEDDDDRNGGFCQVS